ncbi:MAG: hypothetical protein ACK506_07015 [Pirellula sp.]|jgi:hypothetical protein
MLKFVTRRVPFVAGINSPSAGKIVFTSPDSLSAGRLFGCQTGLFFNCHFQKNSATIGKRLVDEPAILQVSGGLAFTVDLVQPDRQVFGDLFLVLARSWLLCNSSTI